MTYTEVALLLLIVGSLFLHHIAFDKIAQLRKVVRRHDKELKEPVQVEIDYMEHDMNERW